MPGGLPRSGVLSGDVCCYLPCPALVLQVQPVTLSPLTSHLRSSDFCTIVDKLNRSCADQTSLTIEQVYPRMCHLVHSYLAGAPCRQRTGNIRLKQSEMSEFNDLILKYTKENILKINIYIKEPFARKYLMVEYASM